ncbi:MAG: hypothetical protein ACTSVG_06480 [Alphaproteobacteria bacterium]
MGCISGSIGNEDVDEVTSIVRQAISAGAYLAISPQSVVTAGK